MSCQSCSIGGVGEATGQTRCAVCDECSTKRGKTRIAALFVCEQFCGSPGCNTGPAELATVPENIVAALVAASGHGSIARVKCPKTGRDAVQLYPGGPVIIIDPDLGADCCIYGPHANCSRRDGDMSPTDVQNVADAYALETIAVNLQNIGPGDWWAGNLGALGVSHVFCVLDFAVTVSQPTAAGPPTVTNITASVTGMAVAGGRIMCSTPRLGTQAPLQVQVLWSQGSYEWGIDKACHKEPGSDITAGRCRCIAPPCAATPSGEGEGGQEWYEAEIPAAVLAALPDPFDPLTDTIELSATVRRCDWLLCADPTVCPPANRRTYLSLEASPLLPAGWIQGRRVVPGDIRSLP